MGHNMEFAQWLQNELNKRGWSQSDLVRCSETVGYKISHTQLSNILQRKRQAGPDTCIALAYVLELSRSEVFRARGWLLTQPDDPYGPKLDPRALGLAKEITELPLESREIALNTMQPMLEAVRQLTEKIQEVSANRQENEN